MTDSPIADLRRRLEGARLRILLDLVARRDDGPLPDAGLLRLLADTQVSLQAVSEVERQHAKKRKGPPGGTIAEDPPARSARSNLGEIT